MFASVESSLRSERMEKFVSYYETFSLIQSALESPGEGLRLLKSFAVYGD